LRNRSTAVASVCVCVCVWARACAHVCVRARAQKGSSWCDWLRFCVCIQVYHAVYRLCPSSRKSFILSYISLENKVQICSWE